MHAGLACQSWVLSATPHALQSWEKASLASGMRIWDEPYQQVQFGRGPTADSDRDSACKRVAANVGRRDMTRSCVAVQVGWNTCLDSCHHCNVCSRCLFAPCLRSHRTWPARIPLPAVWEQTRHRHRMAPQRMPLRMSFNSRTVASSCFRSQPGGSLMRCSNGLHRSKLHTSLTPISTWKSLSRTIRYHETPCKGRPQLGSHPLRDAKVEGGRIDRRLSAWSKQEKRPPRWYMTDSCLKGLRPRTQWAMRREVTWHKWTKICGWVPFLAPLRSQVACLIEPRRESHKIPCRSCPPNRASQSRQSAHPHSSVGFASKCMDHSWEGTVHQHTAIRTDHRRRTARPARDSTAITSLGVPCRRGKIPVRPACAVNHYQSCDPQHAMPSAEAAQAMSTESQLSLGPDAGPNDDSTQVGEAARAREPRSRYRPDGSRRRTQEELQKRRKAKQQPTGFWATPQGRRIAAPREEEPVRNRSQTWQDRDGVWHNWRTPEPASESTSARTRNAQQTCHQTGQDWRRDRPSSSQDWRHDWQWEGDRDRTPQGLFGQRFYAAPRKSWPSGYPQWR